MTAGRLARRANAMPAEDERVGAQGQDGSWRPQEVGVGEEQAWLGGPLTLWDLDGSTTEASEQVGDDIVFDFVLGEPGEYGKQPKHHGFDLGRGASGGKMGRFPVSAALAGRSELGKDYNTLLLVIRSFKIW